MMNDNVSEPHRICQKVGAIPQGGTGLSVFDKGPDCFLHIFIFYIGIYDFFGDRIPKRRILYKLRLLRKAFSAVLYEKAGQIGAGMRDIMIAPSLP